MNSALPAPELPVDSSTSVPLVAPQARKFHSIMVAGDYIDGVMTLDKTLKFVDSNQNVIFDYAPADIKGVFADAADITIHPKNGRRFIVSLNAAVTQQMERNFRGTAVGTVIGNTAGGPLQGAAVGVEAAAIAELGSLQATAKTDQWVAGLQQRGYKTVMFGSKQVNKMVVTILLSVIIGFFLILTILAIFSHH